MTTEEARLTLQDNFGYLTNEHPRITEALKVALVALQQEQPEADLEKETIIDYVHNHYHYDKDFDGYGHSNRRPVFTREDLIDLARHFYELGLKARKEE